MSSSTCLQLTAASSSLSSATGFIVSVAPRRGEPNEVAAPCRLGAVVVQHCQAAVEGKRIGSGVVTPSAGGRVALHQAGRTGAVVPAHDMPGQVVCAATVARG